MTPEQFVYWLQGYVEICKPQERSNEYYDVAAWQEIKNHLDLVLLKQTPDTAILKQWQEEKEKVGLEFDELRRQLVYTAKPQVLTC